MMWLIVIAALITLICARILRDWLLLRRERATLEAIWHRHDTGAADTDNNIEKLDHDR